MKNSRLPKLLNSQQKKAILAMLLGGSILATPTAFAAGSTLIVGVASDYASSELGTVTGSRVTTQVDATANRAVIGNLNRDPAAYSLNYNGKAGFALRQYTYSTTDLKNTTVYITDDDGSIKPIATGIIPGVANMHASAGYGNYIAATGYDLGNVSFAHVNDAGKLESSNQSIRSLKKDIVEYAYETDGGKALLTNKNASVHGEGIYVEGNDVYAVASVNPEGGYDPYTDGLILHYKVSDQGELSYQGYGVIGKNTDSVRISKYNDYLSVSSIGGMQNYGNSNWSDDDDSTQTNINLIRISQDLRFNDKEHQTYQGARDSTFVTLPNQIKKDDVDIHDMQVLPDGTVYVCAYKLAASGAGLEEKVYKTTMANLKSAHPQDWQVLVSSEKEGWFGKIFAEYYTNRLWIEGGNTLDVYTDGDASPTYHWNAKDFSNNENFYQWNSVALVENDTVTGTKARPYVSIAEGLTTYSPVNPDGTENPDAGTVIGTHRSGITGTTEDVAFQENTSDFSNYLFDKDAIIVDTENGEGNGDLTTNVKAAIDVHKGKDVKIDAKDHTLRLQIKTDVGLPSGIYVGNGKNATFDAGRVVIGTSTGSTSGTSLTNAIWVDPSASTTSHLTINAPVSITIAEGELGKKADSWGGNGIAIRKTNRWGEASNSASGASSIEINGDVKIAGKTNQHWGIPLNPNNVYSRFNNSGILTSVDKAAVTVNGNVDFTIYGNGITTNAKDSSVSVKGGKIVVPKQMGYGYYALGAYQGTINMNTDGATPGESTVKLDGDIFALKTGKVNVALTTTDSYLNGIVDSGGTANVWLQNGAQWTNHAQNARYAKETEDIGAGQQSHVSNLVGGTEGKEGVIYQKDTTPIKVDNYSGNTTVIYKHDGTTPTTINGGDFKITNAAADSAITLLTDNAAVTTDNQDDVLNALANKLWYTNYLNGNLSGTVKIAEGLTASSVKVKSGPIAFSDGTTGTKQAGQGYYSSEPSEPKPIPSEFSVVITGGDSHDAVYQEAGVKDGTKYAFTQDTTIRPEFKQYSSEQAAIQPGSSTALTICNEGHRLTLDVNDASQTLLAGIRNQAGKTTEVTANQLDVKVTNSKGDGKAYGLYTFANEGSNLTVTGGVDINVTGPYLSHGVAASAKNSYIDLQGGIGKMIAIKTNKNVKDSAAVSSTDKGSAVYINYDKETGTLKHSDTTVKIDGDVYAEKTSKAAYAAYEKSGSVGLGLTGKESYLHGAIGYRNDTDTEEDEWGDETVSAVYVPGTVHLILDNGATWTNETAGTTTTWADWKGSHVSNLAGGSNANHAGVLFQNDSNPITVDDYSGYTTVIYKHDASNPQTIIGGDFKITNAAEDSAITLLTDSDGITSGFADTDSAIDRNNVSEVLNKLANKLWYVNHNDGNLKGTVKIAEGLTASSREKKVGNITFSTSETGTKQDGQGYYAYTPAKDMKTGPIFSAEVIDKTRAADSNGNVAVTITEATAEGKFVSAMYAGSTSYDKQHPMAVDMSGHNLTLEAKSSNQIAAAIYATDNARMKVANSADDKKLTLRASNEATRAANGIYVKGSYAGVSIEGGVDIDGVTTKGDAATGISVLGKQSEVAVDGPLTIRNVYGKRGRGLGVNASGILVTGDESKVNVNGLVTVEGVQGAALKTVGKETVISVGGGTVTAAKDAEKNHNYYAARVEKGTININMSGDAAGTNTTKITGDMYVTGQYGKRVVEYSGGELIDWTNAGKLNVALTNKDSFWTGMAAYDQYNDDYGTGGNTMHDIGELNLYLQNGAIWTNEQQSHLTTTTVDKSVYQGSQLAALHGGSDADCAGVIYQNDKRPIAVNMYSGNTTVVYKHDASNPQTIIGGDFKITNATENSAITLLTDSDGITSGFADTDDVADRNNVSEVLNKLANKLWYANHNNGKLKGTVKIAEGLTASSKEKKVGDITFSTSETGTKQDGQGYYAYTPAVDIPDSQTTDTFGKAILGSEEYDSVYVNAGVLKDGVYHFTKNTTIAIDGKKDPEEQTRDLIYGDNWVARSITAAISGALPQKHADGSNTDFAKDDRSNVTIDLNHNKLNLKLNYDMGAGIAAVGHGAQIDRGGTVEINNAGAINVDLKTKGLSAALFANLGGKITIHNGGENAENTVLKARAMSTAKNNAAVIKTMNGNRSALTQDGKQSEITIDGLVDVLADGKADENGYAANEAVSAVASTINIGGGSIQAVNGAWAAIRAYGEFVSPNYGIVNINVENKVMGPDKDGSKAYNVKSFDIGNYKTQIVGDIVTNGGMGTKGQINVGLNGKDSYWEGNYADTRGYGVTQGVLGAVNLKMKDGAHWKGFGNGSMNVQMTGNDTYWLGFNIDKDSMQLSLNDGATWHNAITKDQVDQKNKAATAKVGHLSGTGGIIDMTGANVFVAMSSSLSGSPTSDASSAITESKNGVTGDVEIGSYSGSQTVIYKHEIVDNTARENAGFYGNKAASIIGGDFRIANAADGSAITLRTDRDGLNLDSTLYTDKNLVNDTLDKLANKLYYTANDGKLSGKVEIAEGLTASSVSKRLEDITFSTESTGTKTAGQGYYRYDLSYPDSQITNPMDKTIDGTQESEDAYRNAGIYKPGTDEYAFTEDPATVNGDKDKVVDGTNKDLTLKGKTLELVAQYGGTGVYTEDGKKVAIDNKANITAKNGTGVQADGEGSLVSLTNGGSVQETASGIQATNKGTVDIKGSFDVNATDKAISATDGGTVNVAAGTLKGRIEAQNGVVNLNSVEAAAPLKVEGDIETAGEGKVTAHFKGAGSGLAGNVAGDGTVELTVSDGAAWKGDSTGEGATTVTLGKNGTWTGSSTNNKMIVNLAGRWTPTADSIVDELNGKGGTLDKSNAASGTTNIGSYSGSTNVVYRHDASDPTKIVGGKVVIGTAAANSKVNLITDRDGLDLGSGKAADKNKVSETLNRLAHMLTYKDHGANENLKGSVKIAEGLTAGSSDLRSEAITFGEDGVGKYDYTATTEEKPEVIEGNYETKLMKGAKEAMIGAISLWRNNNNDLQRRMGDLRLSREENGIWARYLGGKSAMDSQNTEVDSRYNIYQVGYDHKAGDWTFGAALDHGKSSDSLSGGHGDGELTTLSAYGSLLKKDGQYLDLIARASRVKDEYTVRGELGHKLDGDYKTWGLSLSAEYGKRFTQDNGFYFDPSVELTIGRLNGKDYDAVSDYSGNKKLHVSQEAFNSAIGRIGFGIGQETEKANYFAKLALAHEFAGDIDTTFRADNEPTKNTHIDLGDTWLELELGGTAQLSKNTYLYGTYTRSYGAEVKTKWRADAGLRFTF